MKRFFANLLIATMTVAYLGPCLPVKAASQNQQPPPNSNGSTIDITITSQDPPPGGWPNGEQIPPPNNTDNNGQQMPPPPPPPPPDNNQYYDWSYWQDSDYVIYDDYWYEERSSGVTTSLCDRAARQVNTLLDYGSDYGWHTDFQTIEKNSSRYIVAMYFTRSSRSLTIRMVARDGRIRYQRNGNNISKKKVKRLLRRR